MSLTDWQQAREREQVYEYVCTQIAVIEHRVRKARRRQRRREFLHWCNPFIQVAGHPGEPQP